MNLRKWVMLVGLSLPLQGVACDFPPGFFQQISLDPGNLVVGRDAPVGTVIHQSGSSYRSVEFAPQRIWCREQTTFEVSTPLVQEQGSPWVRPGEVLLHTRIPGVGLVMAASLGPSGASQHWQFIPGLGPFRWGVPHQEIVSPLEWGGAVQTPFFTALKYQYRLVKIGPIDPGMGPQSLAGHVLAEFTSNRSGRVLEVDFSSGSLNVAQCGLPGEPEQQVRVPMGNWLVSQFNGEGSVTESKPFAIPLMQCVGGSVPGNSATAYLRLDPRNGSRVLNALQGIVGLNDESDATGVGVQVLRSDQTPMRLTEELPIFTMADGDHAFPLSARYIQFSNRTPTVGVANASLSFTLIYR